MAAMKTAIGSWAYIWGGYADKPYPLDVVLQRLGELKFDGVELCGFPPHVAPEEWPTKADRQRLVQMLKEQNLGVAGLAANFSAVPPATTDPDQYAKVFATNLELCTDIGSPKIRVDVVSPPTVVPGGLSYNEAFDRIASVWRRCAQMAADAGVKMTWEFEPGFFLNKPSEVVNMLKAVDHPNFSIMLDTCHAYMVGVVGARQMGEKETLPGGVLQFIDMLKGKIGHVHLIDSDGTLHDNETSTHAPFGTGVLNFDELVPAIQKAGYDDPWWAIDLCFWPKAWDVTADAKRYMDGLVAKYGK